MNVGEMQRKLSVWATQDAEHQFHDLYHLLYDEDWLLLAHDYVAQNAGSVTAGCDGIDMAYFDENLWDNLQTIQEALRAGTFEANPVRRVYIPKRNGKWRPLGIPSIRDRIVQEALRMILEPIFEADFVQTSYGFRPNRSHLDAASRILWAASKPRNHLWVIEGDIASYFDTIHHRKLMKLLRRRIADEKMLRLIWRFLRAGVMERNVFRATTEGSPQGGIISPLLANVYLHELDKFMGRYTDLSRTEKTRRRRQGLGNAVHVRYADDFVVMYNGTRAQTEALKVEIAAFLRDHLHLTLSEEKTKVTHLDDGFVFLGHLFQRCRARSGKMCTKVRIPKEKAQEHLGQLRAITAPGSCNDSVDTKLRALNQVIGGWCRYHQIAANVPRTFSRLGYHTYWLLGHWLARKFKTKIWKAIKPYWKDNAFSHGPTRLRLHPEYKWATVLVGAHSKPNPYTTQQVIDREELPARAYWTGYEARPGQADLRLIVLKRDGYQCRICKTPITEHTCQLHHLREVCRFKRPVDANTEENSVVLCIPCHKARTEMRRQQLESRMR